jgi:hypothetical protein
MSFTNGMPRSNNRRGSNRAIRIAHQWRRNQRLQSRQLRTTHGRSLLPFEVLVPVYPGKSGAGATIIMSPISHEYRTSFNFRSRPRLCENMRTPRRGGRATLFLLYVGSKRGAFRITMATSFWLCGEIQSHLGVFTQAGPIPDTSERIFQSGSLRNTSAAGLTDQNQSR